ncbi:MAG: cytochrome C oxidase subunit IV family protein [Planctomycetota bacterium]
MSQDSATDHGAHPGFSANKIFITLFILTMVEVGWALLFKEASLWIKWGGLLVFATWKGVLIYTYFMHMKFEGWIVKCLMIPTPFLIAIVVFALMPDVSHNDRLIYPVGSQVDKSQANPGKVVNMIDHPAEAVPGDEAKKH